MTAPKRTTGNDHAWSEQGSPALYTFQPMTADNACAVLGWRYAEPYTFYNADPAYFDEDLAALLDPRHHYYTLHDAAGQLCGFCCFGYDARVPGGDYEDREALDVGLGIHPDLVGQGRGGPFLAAILDFARAEFAPPRFRATVAGFNPRSRRMFEKAGFGEAVHFLSHSEPPLEFVILVRRA